MPWFFFVFFVLLGFAWLHSPEEKINREQRYYQESIDKEALRIIEKTGLPPSDAQTEAKKKVDAQRKLDAAKKMEKQ